MLETAGHAGMVRATAFSAKQRRRGHCIGPDSLLYTPCGPKPVTEVVPGDLVYSFDDYTLAERKCVAAAQAGIRPVHRVTLEDGRHILLTRDQLMVKVADPKVNLRWAMRWFVWEPLAEFNPGDMVIASRESPHAIEQRPLLEDEEARFLGFRDASLAEYAVNPFFDETYTELLNIRSVQPAGEVPVWEVSMELDESFVANGFVLL